MGVLLAGTLVAAAPAATLVLTPAADATLIEDTGGALANGAGTRLFAGRVGANAGSTLRRGLIRFELEILPPGARVDAVSLTMALERSRQAGDLPVSLHRATSSWQEGPSASVVGIGEPAVDGDVTWLHRRRPDLAWSAPGGDFVATASATRIAGATGGPITWASTPQLVADVQSWVAQPAANHGWVIVGFEGSGTSAKGFAAREGPEPDRPTLRIDYEVITGVEADIPVPPWALVGLGIGFAAALARTPRRHRSTST